MIRILLIAHKALPRTSTSSSNRLLVSSISCEKFKQIRTMSSERHIVAVSNMKVTNDKSLNLEQVKEIIRQSKQQNASVRKILNFI